MKRVHKNLKQASEVVFVDSTSSLDQTNSTLTVFLCGSPLGAMPLGAVVSSHQDQRSYNEGFQLLQDMTKDYGFFSNGAPALFMSDDCAAETNALTTVWPHSRKLLCIFHVFQAVWRWLLSTKNGIPKESRQTFMQLFKDILYSRSEEECDAKYITLEEMSIELQCNTFLKYVSRWMEKKEAWCLAYRSGLLTRGQNTNNCCESTICIIIDVVFNRCKAYNAWQLLHFVTEVYSQYFVHRILNVVLNRKKKILLDTPPLSAQHIITTGDPSKFRFISERDATLLYNVDLLPGICSCFVGCNGAMCKHQKTFCSTNS